MRPVSRREALRMLAASAAFAFGGEKVVRALEKLPVLSGGPEQQGERLVSLQEAVVKAYTRVRMEPAIKSAEVTILEPGQRILVKPSATSGWSEVVVTTGIGADRYVQPVGFPQYIENRAIKMIGEMQLIPFDGKKYDASALLNPDLVPTEDIQSQLEGSASPEAQDLVMGPEQLLGMNVTIDYSWAPLYVQAIQTEQGQINLIKPDQYPLVAGQPQTTKPDLKIEKMKWETLINNIQQMRDTQKLAAVWTPDGVKQIPPPASVQVLVVDWDNSSALSNLGFQGDWEDLRAQNPDLIVKFAGDIVGARLLKDGQVFLVVRVGLNSNQVAYTAMLQEAIAAWTNATVYQAETMIYPRR
jgi:hypothetical protein